MGYSEYGLDEVKKSHDEGKPGNKWCLWCNDNKASTGFSLCFSNWIICKNCVEHVFDVENKYRWEDNVECYKCRAKGVFGYRHHPDNAGMEIHICESCIKWADEVLNNKNFEMTTQALPFSYSEEELIEFKNNILPKLERANKELEYLNSLIEKNDPEHNKEQIEQMIVRQQTFINNLNEALQRIDNKTYGICRTTGKLVDKARLLAVPHATLSLEAKLALHKQSEQQTAPAKPKKERKKAAAKKEEVTISLGNSDVAVKISESDLDKVKVKAGVKYPDEDLRQFKTLISNKLDEANGELKYLKVVLVDRQRGIAIEDYEDMKPDEVQALIDRKKSFISELESALDRVKKKTLGICEETGELIPKEILIRNVIIKRIKPTPDHPSSTIENKTEAENVRTCRICGCTDDDCRQCIEKTGKPCHWIDADLCSACEEEAMEQSESEMPLQLSKVRKKTDISIIINKLPYESRKTCRNGRII
jgi:RNA polymerase-binding transcription factor DksA